MATRTISDAGGNWSANATWVEGSPPDATMDVVATGTSGNITIDQTTCVCKTMVLTNYVGLMTFTAAKVLTVSGSVTFVATQTLAGTGTLAFNAAGTLTMGGLTFPGNLTLSGATLTLAEDLHITNSFTSYTGTNIMNGNTCYIGGSLTGTVNLSGTTSLILNGTGTLSTTTGATISNPITINTAGTITLGTYIGIRNCVFIYTAGTINYGTSILKIYENNTLNTNGMSFYNVVLVTTSTTTLSSNLTLVGSLTSGAGTNVMNGNTCYIGGSLTATVALSGTTNLEMNGSGTISTATAGISVANNLTINTAGVITIGATFGYLTGTLYRQSGTLNTTGLLYINGSCTINTNGAKWPITVFRIASTITLTSAFSAVSIRPYYGTTIIFSGAYSYNVDTIDGAGDWVHGGWNIKFVSGQTLTIATSAEIACTSLGSGTIQSVTPSSPFNLIFSGSISNWKVYGVVFTDVSASSPLPNYNGGTLTRCTNIVNVNLPVTTSNTFCGG